MAKNKPQKIIAKAAPVAQKSLQAAKGTKTRFSLSIKLAFFLGIISFLVYANTLKNGFALDDFQSVRDNVLVNKGLAGISEIFSSPYLGGGIDNNFYRPLSVATFAAEYQAWGINPQAQHFINILLFAASLMLLFFFIDGLFEKKKTIVAFIACFVFALHPIHTELVANIKGRDEILCFLFAFLSLNLFLAYSRKGKLLYITAGLASLFLSLLSKETSATLLAIVPLVFFFYSNENIKRSIIVSSGTALIVAAFLLLRHAVLTSHAAANYSDIPFVMNPLAGPHISYATRLASAIYILGYYVRLFIIPYPLICDYSYNAIPLVSFANIWVLLSLVLYLFLVVAGLWRLFKNKKDPFAFAILFFLVTMALFSNVFFLISGNMAERFMFFSSAGFCLMLALGIEKISKTDAGNTMDFLKQPLIIAILAFIGIAFTSLTVNRNAEWSDNYTLFSSDVAKSPENCRLNYFMGTELGQNVYAEESDPAAKKKIADDAISYLSRSLQIYPDFAEVHLNLAGAYYLRSDFDSAALHAKRALELSPGKVDAIKNLAIIYAAMQKYPEMIALYDKLVHADPKNSAANYYLGNAYFLNAQYDSAEVHEELALQQEPANALVMKDLARVYFFKQKYPEAIALCKRILMVQPTDVDACVDISSAFFNNKRFDSCIYYLNAAIKINPGSPRIYENLSVCYQAMGKADSAKKYEAIVQKTKPGFKVQ